MDANKAGASLDSLMSAFNSRIAELQELVIARNMYPASSVADLSAVDAELTAMELQVQGIKDRVREETLAIPKTKIAEPVMQLYTETTDGSFIEKKESAIVWHHRDADPSFGSCQAKEMLDHLESVLANEPVAKLIDAALKQQKKLQSMSIYVPSHIPERLSTLNLDSGKCLQPETTNKDACFKSLKLEEEPAAPPKEKKGRSPPPLWFITDVELDSVSSYMKGRLTLEKINAAINDMAAYAEANAQLIAAPKKKLAENLWEKALELRDIAMTEAVKGKHFFIESDIKGPALKLDNTGKAILTPWNYGRGRWVQFGVGGWVFRRHPRKLPEVAEDMKFDNDSGAAAHSRGFGL
ncbi:hypothetical protein TIFTF001_013890 [Ficus carica]|uniref:SKA complex subunit 1 homolog n=1 Tax=Ficus carica TaxID=3494 RepID=A0AA88A547_FICCA|nr:hypothetical protein TIFTF001_013890 [Ficus carica]